MVRPPPDAKCGVIHHQWLDEAPCRQQAGADAGCSPPSPTWARPVAEMGPPSPRSWKPPPDRDPGGPTLYRRSPASTRPVTVPAASRSLPSFAHSRAPATAFAPRGHPARLEKLRQAGGQAAVFEPTAGGDPWRRPPTLRRSGGRGSLRPSQPYPPNRRRTANAPALPPRRDRASPRFRAV